jgi:hypothetical protein
VTTVGEIKTHQTLVGAHQGLVDLEVGRAARKALDVDTPLGGVEAESLEGTLLAGDLNGIDVLVATVVTGTGVTLGVLVAHGRTQSIEDSAGGEVLRGNQDDGLALTLDLLLLQTTAISNQLSKNDAPDSFVKLSNQLGYHIP